MKRLTMVDVVVVVLICVFVVVLLVPVCARGRGYTRDLICLLNVRGLSRAWNLYHEDNDGWLVGGSTYNSTEYRWAERPLLPNAPIPLPEGVNPSSYEARYDHLDFEARMRGIRAGRLFTYTENEKLYHCPNDRNIVEHEEPYAVFRTYAISGLMNGEDSRGDYGGTVTFPDGQEKLLEMARKTDQIIHPAEKYIFVEEDVVNASVHGAQSHNLGSFVLMSGSNYWRWWDIPGWFHGNRGNLGFADGHAEMHTWQDPRTIALMTHERGTRGQPSNTQPDNEDIVYMNEGYLACD